MDEELKNCKRTRLERYYKYDVGISINVKSSYILKRLIYILRFLFSSGRKEKKQCFKVQSQIAY